MAKKPKILAFAGSLRENSYNKRVLKIAVEGARNAGADVTVIDLKDYSMPIYNEDDQNANGFHPNAIRFQEVLDAHDGFLIASPEYNGSLPGGFKNALDWASRSNDKFTMNRIFKGKVAAIITASPGSFGGIRCLGHLRSVLSVLGMNVLPAEIAVSFAGKLFEDGGGEIKDEKMKHLLENQGAALAAMLRKTHGETEIAAESGVQ